MSPRIRRALVTGASAGLGRALAHELARREVDLVLVARRRDRLEEVAVGLPVSTEVVAADLADPDELRTVEKRLGSDREPVDLVVNNAGFGAYDPVHELDPEHQTRMVDLNCRAVVALTRAALPRLVEERRGGVINIGSTAAYQPGPYGAVYGASKAFVRWFTEALHEELRGTGVRAMLASPGVIRTEFQEVARVAHHRIPAFAWTPVDEVAARILEDFTRGRAVSVPGALNRVQTALADVAPTGLARRVAARVLHRWRVDP